MAGLTRFRRARRARSRVEGAWSAIDVERETEREKNSSAEAKKDEGARGKQTHEFALVFALFRFPHSRARALRRKNVPSSLLFAFPLFIAFIVVVVVC